MFHQVRIKSAVAQTALRMQSHKRQRVKSGTRDEEPLFTPVTNKKIAEFAQKSKECALDRCIRISGVGIEKKKGLF